MVVLSSPAIVPVVYAEGVGLSAPSIFLVKGSTSGISVFFRNALGKYR
jgi:hypothetical protein